MSPHLPGLAAAALLLAAPAFALESQSLHRVERLPAEFRQVMSCGQWVEGGDMGHFRVVVVDVGGGLGNEVCVQRIREVAGNPMAQELLETTTFPPLNDDHGPYRIGAAACKRHGRPVVVELVAAFEHDAAGVEHLITIQLGPSRPYRVTNTRRRVATRGDSGHAASEHTPPPRGLGGARP